MDFRFEIFEKDLFERIDKIINKNQPKSNINLDKSKTSSVFKKKKIKINRNKLKTKKNKNKNDNLENNYFIKLLLDEIKSKSLIKKDEEIKLLKSIKEEDSEELKKQFIERNLRFIYYYLNRYFIYNEDEFLDLFQESAIAMMQALDKFDINYGNRFVTYAAWWIRQKILRYWDNTKTLIRLPVHLKKNNNKIKQYFKNDKINLSKDYLEVYKKGIFSEKEIENFYIQNFYEYFSLESKIKELPSDFLAYFDLEEDNLESNILLKDIIPVKENDIFQKVEYFDNYQKIKNITDKVFEELKIKEKEVLFLRLGIYDNVKYTLEEIGFRYNLTRERIRQIEKKALLKIQERLKNSGFTMKIDEIEIVIPMIYSEY